MVTARQGGKLRKRKKGVGIRSIWEDIKREALAGGKWVEEGFVVYRVIQHSLGARIMKKQGKWKRKGGKGIMHGTLDGASGEKDAE